VEAQRHDGRFSTTATNFASESDRLARVSLSGTPSANLTPPKGGFS